MIKYFYYEQHYINDEYITINEKILKTKPKTAFDGFDIKEKEIGIYKFWVDVEKRIEYNGNLDQREQKVYDTLLIELRKLKLDTI